MHDIGACFSMSETITSRVYCPSCKKYLGISTTVLRSSTLPEMKRRKLDGVELLQIDGADGETYALRVMLVHKCGQVFHFDYNTSQFVALLDGLETLKAVTP